MAEGRLHKIALKGIPKQKRARGRPKKNWMEGIKKAMNERNLHEGQCEDREQWSLGFRQRKKNVLKPIYKDKITNLIENRQQTILFGNTLKNLVWLKYCGIRICILLVSDKSFSNCALYYYRICYFMTLKPVPRTY
jgi:hypothetical protein